MPRSSIGSSNVVQHDLDSQIQIRPCPGSHITQSFHAPRRALNTTHDAFKEWQRVSAGRMCDYSKFTWQQLEEEGGVQWGGDRLYADGVFPTTTGKATLYTVPCLPFVEQPDEEYNLIFNTGRTVEHWAHPHQNRQGKNARQHGPQRMARDEPGRRCLELRPHDRVNVVSRRSTVRNVELRITSIVAPGQVFMPFHFLRDQLQPRHPRRIRSYLARAKLQAMCRPHRKIFQNIEITISTKLPNVRRTPQLNLDVHLTSTGGRQICLQWHFPCLRPNRKHQQILRPCFRTRRVRAFPLRSPRRQTPPRSGNPYFLSRAQFIKSSRVFAKKLSHPIFIYLISQRSL